MSEPVIVRYGPRNVRWWTRSIRVESPDASDHHKLTVRYGDKTRSLGHIDMPGFGRMRQSQVVGINKARLAIRLDGEYLHDIPATKAEVDKHVRRMRPQELAGLNEIDAEIEEAQRRLGQLRRKRVDFLHDAFQKGHVVTVSELRERAEAGLP